ncbi:tRNA pseudouridine(38-40) synthase TruA [Clostridium sp.]|uniref:tRNA pseudouridine(38-40) synthase TruA n=1 Tax=Clostridium sp. TaxID=1506 RepID=UPI003217B6CD
MRNLKMVIEYDGTRYKGWQKQKDNVATIQDKIEKVLSKMTNEEIQVVGCGRTDTGVHAKNYIANFHTKSTLTNEDIFNYLYEFLPDDIVVKSVTDVHERFHSRYNAKAKTYVYTINNSKHRDVFSRKYTYHTDAKLNLNAMRAAADILVGTHDFQSFTALKSDSKSTVRTVNFIEIIEDGDMVQIEINGDGFLLNMVRIITGTLLEVGKGALKASDVAKILEQKKRSEAGPMAQAKGLCLKEVEYQ